MALHLIAGGTHSTTLFCHICLSLLHCLCSELGLSTFQNEQYVLANPVTYVFCHQVALLTASIYTLSERCSRLLQFLADIDLSVDDATGDVLPEGFHCALSKVLVPPSDSEAVVIRDQSWVLAQIARVHLFPLAQYRKKLGVTVTVEVEVSVQDPCQALCLVTAFSHSTTLSV